MSNKNAYGELSQEELWVDSVKFRYNKDKEINGAYVILLPFIIARLDIKVGDRVILRDHTSVNLGNSPAHPVPIHTTVRMQGDSLCAPVHLAYLHYFGTSSEPQLTFGVQKELKREVPL